MINFGVFYFAKFPNSLSETSCHVKVKGSPRAVPKIILFGPCVFFLNYYLITIFKQHKKDY